jgi:hypothetical protein
MLFVQISSLFWCLASAYRNHHSSLGISLQHSNVVALGLFRCLFFWGTDDYLIHWLGVAWEACEELMLMTSGLGPLESREECWQIGTRINDSRASWLFLEEVQTSRSCLHVLIYFDLVVGVPFEEMRKHHCHHPCFVLVVIAFGLWPTSAEEKMSFTIYTSWETKACCLDRRRLDS